MSPDRELLGFWFGPRPGSQRREWFRKDDRFDEELRRRFGDLHSKASRRELEGWRDSPEPMLALVILLDQLSRNLYRDDARAFAQDAHALECAAQAISRGDDLELPLHRQQLQVVAPADRLRRAFERVRVLREGARVVAVEVPR